MSSPRLGLKGLAGLTYDSASRPPLIPSCSRTNGDTENRDGAGPVLAFSTLASILNYARWAVMSQGTNSSNVGPI